ncbi:MAG: M48 family metallopeptidase [Anaerolineae bacterium]|nr:M48 family metallopeptidase [Anaerolineae bacterium]
MANSPTFASGKASGSSKGDPASSSGELEIVLVRSARRKKTVSARFINWYTLEVRAPAQIPDDELQKIIDDLVQKALKRRGERRQFSSHEDLERRAQILNRRYFEGELRWQSVRYVTNQNTRFGSCTPVAGTIRISHRLAGAPSFVLDYVIMHELAHLLKHGHSQAFWDLVYRYPKTERARGYLLALGMESDLVAGQGDPSNEESPDEN